MIDRFKPKLPRLPYPFIPPFDPPAEQPPYIPPERSGEYFGLMDICGKGASFMGTTVVGLASQAFGSINGNVAFVAIVNTPSFAVFTVAVPLAEVLDSADFLSLLLPHPANIDTDITTASATAANFFIFIFLSPLFHFITSFSKKICVL